MAMKKNNSLDSSTPANKIINETLKKAKKSPKDASNYLNDMLVVIQKEIRNISRQIENFILSESFDRELVELENKADLLTIALDSLEYTVLAKGENDQEFLDFLKQNLKSNDSEEAIKFIHHSMKETMDEYNVYKKSSNHFDLDIADEDDPTRGHLFITLSKKLDKAINLGNLRLSDKFTDSHTK